MEETMQSKLSLRDRIKEQWKNLNGKLQEEKNKKKILYIGISIAVLIIGFCLLAILGGSAPAPRTEDEIKTKALMEAIATKYDESYGDGGFNWYVEYRKDGIAVICQSEKIETSVLKNADETERQNFWESYTDLGETFSKGFYSNLESNLYKLGVEKLPVPIYYHFVDRYKNDCFVYKDGKIIYSRY